MTLSSRFASIFVPLLALGFCPVASAVFSDDPAVNFAVADRSGEQTQVKLAARDDGMTYVSWFDNSSGGYDVYLQLLDIDGSEVWPHNGVLVADRSFSSTQDYGLAIDIHGNALLAFRDDRGAGINITAAAVDVGGNLLWGAAGAQVANGVDFVAAPKITGPRDGTVVVAWTNDDDVMLQKIDQSGATLWATPVTLTDPGGGSLIASDLKSTPSGLLPESGGTIVSMVRQTSFSSPKHLHAQMVSVDGESLWGESPIVVFDGGSLQFGNFPTFAATENGAVFTWYDTAAGLKCYVQKITRTGGEVWPHNGVAVSSSSRDCVNPAIAYDPIFNAAYVFWSEIQPGPVPQYGVYGQRFQSSATGLWGPEGIAVASLAAEELTQVRVVFDDYNGEFNGTHGDVLVFWVEALGFGNDRVMAARLDEDGDPEWTPAQTTVANTPSDKSRLAAVANVPGQINPGRFFTLGWSDDRSDVNDVYVQNVNGDGSLGNDPVDADLDGVNDTEDNCTLAVNSDQRDTNADGIGNWCDADINNDCLVNFLDLEIYRAFFFSLDNPDTDNDGNGGTDFVDLFIAASQFFGQPGPSAAGCDSLP